MSSPISSAKLTTSRNLAILRLLLRFIPNHHYMNLLNRKQEDVYVTGRIALDAESLSSGTVKLNEESVVLESSRMMGSGARIPLQFSSNLKLRGIAKGSGSIGLFPGAIVAVRGRNGGGQRFVVSEILSVGSVLFK
jgi:hypothetical protein